MSDSFSTREKKGRKELKTPPAHEIVLSRTTPLEITHPGEGDMNIYAQTETHSWGLPVRVVFFVNGGLYYTTTISTPELARKLVANTLDGHADTVEDMLYTLQLAKMGGDQVYAIQAMLYGKTLVTLARRITEAHEAEEMRQSQVEMFG